MTTSVQNKSSGFFRGTLAAVTVAVLAILLLALPQGAEATSAGATIYNTVKVTYTSGTANLFATANVSVAVNLVPAAVSVTNPAGLIVAAGGTASYAYVVKSNANGLDTYTTSALANTPTNVGGATGTSVTADVTLWGGNALGSGAGTITVPFGTTTGLVANTSTVQIGANQYTVTGIAPGTAASTNAITGNLVLEAPATLTLAPIGAAPAITTGLIGNGTQVGEFKAAALTAALTAGTPTTPGTDGTYSTSYTISSTATPVASMTTVAVITTVSSPRVTIVKTASAANVNPGGTITYTITVTNTHTTASVTGATIIDPVPAYTTYTSGSTRLNGETVNGDGAVSPMIAGLLIDSDGTRAAGTLATGTLPPLGVAIIVYSVVVQ
jgi:large repetitive protein